LAVKIDSEIVADPVVASTDDARTLPRTEKRDRRGPWSLRFAQTPKMVSPVGQK
jgi:hypothetical protein